MAQRVPHVAIARHHVVGLTVIGTGVDIPLVEAQVVGELEGIGEFRVQVGVAK